MARSAQTPRDCVESPPGRRRLEVRYPSVEAFRREFEANLCKGGLFVPTEEPLALRDEVEVRLDLAFRGERLSLEGEVVHQVGPELARAGAVPGVAVHFRVPAPELRARLGPLLEDAGNRGGDGSPGPGSGSRVSASPPAVGEVEESAGPDLEALLGGAAPGPERRGARRREVRAPVHLDTTDGSARVRTRNLSTGGVLVTMEEDPVPVGARVRVLLANPVTGRRAAVEGDVVRHLPTEGGLTAVAIRFDVEPSRRPHLERFVEACQEAEHVRRLGGISGPIEEVGLANLIQMFGTCSPRGTVAVFSGPREGSVAFEAGRLLAARVGRVTGIKALSRMLAWEEGRFEFHARVDAVATGEDLALDAALFEAVRQVDELGRIDRSSLPAEARFEVAGPVCEEELGKGEQAVVDLAEAGLEFGRILDVVPLPDAEVYEITRSLLERGLIRRVPGYPQAGDSR